MLSPVTLQLQYKNLLSLFNKPVMDKLLSKMLILKNLKNNKNTVYKKRNIYKNRNLKDLNWIKHLCVIY